MSFRFLPILGFFALFSFETEAVANPDSIVFSRPLNMFKFLPSGVLDIPNAVYAFSFERALRQSPVSIGMEFGFMGKSNWGFNNQDRNPDQLREGYLIRPFARYYTGGLWEGNLGYVEFQPFYKFQERTYEDWLIKIDPATSARYQRFEKISYRKSAVGFNVLLGFTQETSNSRYCGLIEGYVGVGLRYKDIDYSDFSPSTVVPTELSEDWSVENRRGLYPTIQFGIRLGVGVGRFFQ